MSIQLMTAKMIGRAALAGAGVGIASIGTLVGIGSIQKYLREKNQPVAAPSYQPLNNIYNPPKDVFLTTSPPFPPNTTASPLRVTYNPMLRNSGNTLRFGMYKKKIASAEARYRRILMDDKATKADKEAALAHLERVQERSKAPAEYEAEIKGRTGLASKIVGGVAGSLISSVSGPVFDMLDIDLSPAVEKLVDGMAGLGGGLLGDAAGKKYKGPISERRTDEVYTEGYYDKLPSVDEQLKSSRVAYDEDGKRWTRKSRAIAQGTHIPSPVKKGRFVKPPSEEWITKTLTDDGFSQPEEAARTFKKRLSNKEQRGLLNYATAEVAHNGSVSERTRTHANRAKQVDGSTIKALANEAIHGDDPPNKRGKAKLKRKLLTDEQLKPYEPIASPGYRSWQAHGVARSKDNRERSNNFIAQVSENESSSDTSTDSDD